MKPFIKWAGGKDKELKYFSKYYPNNIHNYIEPFLGGGSVYFSTADINITGQRYINDFSSELISLYQKVKNDDELFYQYLEKINDDLKFVSSYCYTHKAVLDSIKNINQLKDFLSSSKETIVSSLNFNFYNITELNSIYDMISSSKCLKIEKIFRSNEEGPDNIIDLFECVIKSIYYTYIRYIYNQREEAIKRIGVEGYAAVLFYIRDFCYSSMFRYNANGEFNIPYGGICYNKKTFDKKIENMKSKDLASFLHTSNIYNLDFEEFLNSIEITPNDFIFLDPPYDSKFSSYMDNEFNQNDQLRLANWLSNTTARVMVVIKSTDFIYNLYSERGFNITSFNKKYNVNIKNRNTREVKHLIITNYDLEDLL